jgi:hypothetical protein
LGELLIGGIKHTGGGGKDYRHFKSLHTSPRKAEGTQLLELLGLFHGWHSIMEENTGNVFPPGFSFSPAPLLYRLSHRTEDFRTVRNYSRPQCLMEEELWYPPPAHLIKTWVDWGDSHSSGFSENILNMQVTQTHRIRGFS